MTNRARASSLRASSVEPTKRLLNKQRDLWLEFFGMALESMLPADKDDIKGISQLEAEIIARAAREVSDAALAQVEERFPGL